MSFISKLFGIKKEPKKIKIGLALGSGGAKGFAELGAMRAFEENDIYFDCFAGTSIGSILGAFFADGYSSTDITELLRGVDFNEIKNLFMINMSTSGLFGVIDRYIGSLSFGGPSIIIIVGVILETLKQVESLMLVRYYKGFLND